MQNKKRLHKHLLIIYIIYFTALVVGFAASFVPGFSEGWSDASDTLSADQQRGNVRTYYVTAPICNTGAEQITIAGLPENVRSQISRLELRVSVNEGYTLGNAFKVMSNNAYSYLLMAISGLSYLAVLILIALIINSLRKSIRDEQPIRNSNIKRTRIIGILILAAELCDTLMKYINNQEAVRLLADTSFEVSTILPFNYWNLIVGILFLFMAEVFAIGTQLSEEQKLTI